RVSARRNLLRHRSLLCTTPEDEERLCQKRLGCSRQELHDKARSHPDNLTRQECDMIVHCFDYDWRKTRDQAISLERMKDLPREDRLLVLTARSELEDAAFMKASAKDKEYRDARSAEARRKRDMIKAARNAPRAKWLEELAEDKLQRWGFVVIRTADHDICDARAWRNMQAYYGRECERVFETWKWNRHADSNLSKTHESVLIWEPALDGASTDALRAWFKAKRDELPEGVRRDCFLVVDEDTLANESILNASEVNLLQTTQERNSITLRAVDPDYDATKAPATVDYGYDSAREPITEADLEGFAGEVRVPDPVPVWAPGHPSPEDPLFKYLRPASRPFPSAPNMLSALYRFALRHWQWYITRALQLWRKFSLRIASPSRHHEPDPSQLLPLTDQQHNELQDKFKKAVDPEAIRNLASAYNKHLPCRIDESGAAHGSYNICYFVEFNATAETLVVRVPIEPAIHDVWAKVESEVCTIRYIQDKTSIPVPRILAYGRSRLLRNESKEQAYMIMTCVNGEPLDKKVFEKSERDRRIHFFNQLIDILAQLRALEFPAAGSLMPHWSCRSKPSVSGLLSIPLNQVQLDGLMNSPGTAMSAPEFIDQVYDVLHVSFSLPIQDPVRNTLEKEYLVQNFIKENLSFLFDDCRGESFVLSHTDLRHANIRVDEKLQIQGIIDWEWACSVPQRFFIPPSWILTSEDMLADFRSALALRRDSSPAHTRLMDEWTPKTNLRANIARLLLQPGKLMEFYLVTYQKCFADSENVTLGRFFMDAGHSAKIDKKLRDSEHYTQYLKENNLYFIDEHTKRMKKWLAEGERLMESFREDDERREKGKMFDLNTGAPKQRISTSA
ncbi:hypothetical protein TOPH_07046, partial [Tolypocladium ophioglossoides CBS 100239]